MVLCWFFYSRRHSLRLFEDGIVNQVQILVIRVIIGIVFGVVISRIFFHAIRFDIVAGLVIFMVGMAYVAEYFRNRRSGQ